MGTSAPQAGWGQAPDDRDGDATATPTPVRPSLRTLLQVAVVGAVTTGGAYAISGGSIPIFVGVMVGFGVLMRVGARLILWRKGQQPRRGWWL